MTKRYAILQKKLAELESELSQVLPHAAADTTHQSLVSEGISHRFSFLNTLLYAEIASHPSKPHHLRHISRRLDQLAAAFHFWDNHRISAPEEPAVHDDNNAASSCSCTGSCLNDDGEEEVDNSPDGSSLVCDEEEEETETFYEAVEEEKEKEKEVAVEAVRAEERRGWIWWYCGVMGGGVVVGAVLMGFVTARFCWGCFDKYVVEYDVFLVPT